MTSGDLNDALNVQNKNLTDMSICWKLFGQLFNSGPANLDALNRSGSVVFHLLQVLIVDDLILSLCRLTDQETIGSDDNLSVDHIVRLARQYLVADPIVIEADDLVSRLKIQVKNIRKYRNKALAHTDLAHALNAKTLPDITYDELDSALRTIKEVVSKVASACRWTIPVDYDVIIPFGKGVDELLKVLKRGLV